MPSPCPAASTSFSTHIQTSQAVCCNRICLYFVLSQDTFTLCPIWPSTTSFPSTSMPSWPASGRRSCSSLLMIAFQPIISMLSMFSLPVELLQERPTERVIMLTARMSTWPMQTASISHPHCMQSEGQEQACSKVDLTSVLYRCLEGYDC